jgi:hypothetical protein
MFNPLVSLGAVLQRSSLSKIQKVVPAGAVLSEEAKFA